MANFLADMAPAMSEMRQGLTGIAQLQMQQQKLSEDARHTRTMEGMASDQLDITKAQEDRAKTKFGYEQEEIEKKKKWGKALSPVLGIAPLIDQNPNTKKYLVDAVKAAGFEYKEENGVALVQNDAIPFIQQKMATDLDFSKKLLEQTKLDAGARFQPLYKLVGELRANGKEIKPEMMQQLKALGDEYAGIENGLKELNVEANRQNIKAEIERLQQEGIWPTLPNALKISAQLALRNGDLGEFNKVLTEVGKAEVKPERATTEAELLSGMGGTPEQRRNLIEGRGAIRAASRQMKPGEAYTALEKTFAGRINEAMKIAGITDVQANQLIGGQVNMTDILAEMISKKKITPQGIEKLNKNLERIKKARELALEDLEEGRTWQKRLREIGEPERTILPTEEAVSHGGPVTYEYKGGKLTKK